MTNLDSDAFVCFGATDDLAFKQIFHALQAMIVDKVRTRQKEIPE